MGWEAHQQIGDEGCKQQRGMGHPALLDTFLQTSQRLLSNHDSYPSWQWAYQLQHQLLNFEVGTAVPVCEKAIYQ